MATGNAELNYRRRKDDASPAPSRRNVGRPAFQPYEQTQREGKREDAAPALRNEEDYHPETPLKTLTPAEIRAFVVVILVVTIVAMGIVYLSAQAAIAQKDINDLKKGITQVDDDIANLKIEIEQAQNMQIIKNRAQDELGMKDPAFDQYVNVSDLPETPSDFGAYIKERAYGGARTQTADADAEAGQ